jgi:hypothetical protein
MAAFITCPAIRAACELAPAPAFSSSTATALTGAPSTIANPMNHP